MGKPIHEHDARCFDEHDEWSGSPNYDGDPANEWVCDVCGNVIPADQEG